MNKLLVLLAVLGFSLGAQALEVDASQSEFKWKGTKVTGEHYGKLPLVSSKVEEKNGKVTGGEFVLNVSKLTVDDSTPDSLKKKLITHMKSADFFDVEEWPTAKLVITKLDGKKAYGELHIKDKKNKVSFPYKKKDNLYTGTLTFDRTKFGMIYGSGNFFQNLGDKMIHNEVTVEFKVKVDGAKKKLANNK